MSANSREHDDTGASTGVGADPAHDVEEQRKALQVAAQRTGLSPQQLWLRYLALGGDVGAMEVEAYLQQLMDLPRRQRNILAHALNEHLAQVSQELTVPYDLAPALPERESQVLGRGVATSASGPLGPVQGSLAAAVALLHGVQHAPPERLVSAVEAAGAAMGVQFTLHLLDYAQRHLVPVLADPARPGLLFAGEVLPVESTVAGRAFRRVRTVVTDGVGGTGEQPGDGAGVGEEHSGKWWVPLLDDDERLGVLEVRPLRVEQLQDLRLRQECEWISQLIGHLITVVNASGDALDRLRRTQGRTPSAELIWDLLPPLSVSTDRVVIAGQLEPSAGVGGDAFDHAVSETRAHLAVFDATGHSVASGLVVAAALAASRSVRRAGGGLFAQSQAIEEVVREQFADRGLLLTGVLAELDLRTGRLRYLVAGHPEPLLLREGRVVKTLNGGRRALFGIDQITVTIGEEHLQPGDCVLLYTDGVTEARDEDGNFFGQDRLQNFLQRSAAAAHPPPETVRRLLGAVMKHQHDRLQDDATVLLAGWTPQTGTADLDLDAIAAGG